jgi:hypothetical protein
MNAGRAFDRGSSRESIGRHPDEFHLIRCPQSTRSRIIQFADSHIADEVRFDAQTDSREKMLTRAAMRIKNGRSRLVVGYSVFPEPQTNRLPPFTGATRLVRPDAIASVLFSYCPTSILSPTCRRASSFTSPLSNECYVSKCLDSIDLNKRTKPCG